MVFQMPMESFDPRCTLGDGIGESLRNMGISLSLIHILLCSGAIRGYQLS